MQQFQLDTDTQESMDMQMHDASVRYVPAWLSGLEADQVYEDLYHNVEWSQATIALFGQSRKIPRLQAWYGDSDATYTYSGLTMQPLPWTKTLLGLKSRLEMELDTRFNSVLANLYRDGRDSMGFHADDEPELQKQPVIASVSLGELRNFDFRHKYTGDKIRITPLHGSLIVMQGQTQEYWQHGINKTKKNVQPRINLTFRHIKK